MFYNKNEKKSSLISWFVLSLVGGMVGTLIVIIYFINAIDVSFFWANSNFGNSFGNIMPQLGNQRIIVEYDVPYDKILDNINYSLADVYKTEKSVIPSANNLLNIDDIIYPDQYIGKAAVLTNDGWLLLYVDNGNKKEEEYRVVFNNGDKKIYKTTGAIKDKFTGATFLKINGIGLSVMPLASEENIRSGQTIIIAGRNNNIIVKNIINAKYSKIEKEDDYVKSADVLNRRILIDGNFDKDYSSAPVININGELVGIFDYANNYAVGVNSINSALKNILKNKKIERPSLKIEYIDLDSLIAENYPYKKGALIHNISPTIKDLNFGLKKGDIILKVEEDAVRDNNLPELIQEYEKGTILNFTILRGEKEIVEKVLLN